MKKSELVDIIVIVGIFIITVFSLSNFFINKDILFDGKDSIVLEDKKQLKIASFNVQVLGRSKMKKPEVVDNLLKILSRYDIIFIQELRDKSGLAIKKLLAKLNEKSDSHYQSIISKRLGITSSKEQYVFFYKDPIKIISIYQHIGSKSDFNRDPFAVLFTYYGRRFGLLGVHIDPDDVKKELNNLDDVYYDVSRSFSTKNLLLFGDFNADCSYLSNYALKMLDLKRNKKFIWYIDSKQDTTVSQTDCAYDRLISNKDFYYKVDNVSIFNFKDEYNLTYRNALKVSDHFPIEFDLILKDWLLSVFYYV